MAARTPGPLWDALPLSRRDDPASSIRAAERQVRSGKAYSAASLILAAIRAYPGMTAKQLESVVGIIAYTVRKRTADLRRRKLAYSRRPRDGGDLRWYPGRDPRDADAD